MKREGRGVIGRRVRWGRLLWTVRAVAGPSITLEREARGRVWILGGLARAAVKFVRHDYTVHPNG